MTEDQAALVAHLRETDPHTAGLTDEQVLHNAAIQYGRWLDKDCLAKTWFMAEPSHPAVYRALKIDPADPAAWYASAPFRLIRYDSQHVIAAAWPAPRLLSDYPEDWAEIETVLIWRPNLNTVEIPEDIAPQLLGAFENLTEGAVFASPFAFFRAWAEERAALFTRWKAARNAHWIVAPSEANTPGKLIVGDLAKIRMPIHELPRDITAIGVDPKALNAAIQRSARLPRAHTLLKAAA